MGLCYSKKRGNAQVPLVVSTIFLCKAANSLSDWGGFIFTQLHFQVREQAQNQKCQTNGQRNDFVLRHPRASLVNYFRQNQI